MKKIEQQITKKLQEEKKRSSETEDHEKQHLTTPKRCDENELERKLRLEKVVASKHPRWRLKKYIRRARLDYDAATKRLSLAMETDEERKARLEKMVATKWLFMEMDKERKARLEKMVATTQLRLALETEEEQKMDWINGLDLIWIEIGVWE